MEGEREPDEMPIVLPIIDRLTPKKLRELTGRWKFISDELDEDDKPEQAICEFTSDHRYTVVWGDNQAKPESGHWLARANRIELYKIQAQEEPNFRFFVVVVSNQWQLVNADARRGLSPLSRVATASK